MENKTGIFKKGICITLILFVITTLYTLIINGFAQTFFNHSANGSILIKNGEVVGSENIGQSFKDSKYFHGRPSVSYYNTYSTKEEAETTPASGGSNLAVSNPEYKTNIKSAIKNLLKENPGLKVEDIPAEMITSSASGLDPHITVQGALIQAERVTKMNGISKDEVINLINKVSHNGIINVLELNLALEDLNK